MDKITQDFNTDQGIEAYMREQGLDLEGLLVQVRRGRLRGDRAGLAFSYIERQVRHKRTQAESDRYYANERLTEANEPRATTAWVSARALVATIISIFSAIVAGVTVFAIVND